MRTRAFKLTGKLLRPCCKDPQLLHRSPLDISTVGVGVGAAMLLGLSRRKRSAQRPEALFCRLCLLCTGCSFLLGPSDPLLGSVTAPAGGHEVTFGLGALFQ